MRKVLLLSLFLCTGLVRGQDTLKLSLLFTGDIMQHDGQIANAYDPATGKYDYKPCFQYIKPVLSAPDLTIGNLELTLAGPPYKGYPQFSAPDEILEALKDAGYDVLVTANNHCVDRGKVGLERTISLLDSAGFLHTGTFTDTVEWLNNNPLIIEAKGFRLALLNYTYGTNGMPVYAPNMVNRIESRRIKGDLQNAQALHPDAIIVFVHWGQEYQRLPNEWQKSMADFMFENGAKMVIGAHPHVIQPMEWRKEKDQLIVYSLGNFVSNQRERFRNGGAMAYVELSKVTSNGSTSVSIKDVSYSLEYVHRGYDARKSFLILPVEHFENDSTVIRGAALQSLRQFRDDARDLYQKESKNVREKR